MRASHATAFGMALGYLGDVLTGDPRHGHPVAAFGRAAAALERRTWRDHRAAGVLHTALCAGGVAAASAALAALPLRGAPTPPPGGGGFAPPPGAAEGRADGSLRGQPAGGGARFVLRSAGEVAVPPGRWPGRSPSGRAGRPGRAPGGAVFVAAGIAWAVLGGTSLAREARGVRDALAVGDVAGARELLPRLCGRDPQALDAPGIARAVVESVAENTSDAVVGALVWGALAGVPGMAAFRAVNTLDAMVGHRSPRYRRFGWAAARLDDLAGWPGARLTALLAAAAGPDPRGALRVWRADARRHPSPNAGPVEAAFAGALGVRLGGTLSYGGRVEHRPVLNAPGRAVELADIERAVRLSRRVGALALAICCAGVGAAR